MNQQIDVDMDARETRDDPQPNLGAYFLTVGLVSIAFGSVFSLVFSGIVTLLLLAVVIGVAIISVAAGLYSESDLLFPET
jgi:hypothetical protein